MPLSVSYMQSADLRGLKKDIKNKIKACLKEDRLCSKSTLSEGFLSIGENIQYKSHVDATQCVSILQDCIEENPWMQYHSTDLYLSIEFWQLSEICRVYIILMNLLVY